MALKAAKCESCGASIDVDESRENGFCPFCGTKYYTEKIIQNTYVTNNYEGAIINVIGTDIEKHISLIENDISIGNLNSANAYLREALAADPNDARLWTLKIKIINVQWTLNPIIGVDAVQKGFLDSFVELTNAISKLEGNPELLEEAFNGCFEALISCRKEYAQIIEKCDRVLDEEKKFNREIPEQVNNNVDLACYAYIDGIACLVALMCNQHIPLNVLDRMVNYLKDDSGVGSVSTWLVSLYCPIIKEFDMNLKEALLSYGFEDHVIQVKNKKGKIKEAEYFGSYIVYYVRKAHPSYNTDSINELDKMLQETDKGGCYVATAVYGSYDCPQVWALRRFRDYTLSKTIFGRLFIKTYYAISPTLVKWFGELECFKRIFRVPLDKLVNKLLEAGVSNLPYDDITWN